MRLASHRSAIRRAIEPVDGRTTIQFSRSGKTYPVGELHPPGNCGSLSAVCLGARRGILPRSCLQKPYLGLFGHGPRGMVSLQMPGLDAPSVSPRSKTNAAEGLDLSAAYFFPRPLLVLKIGYGQNLKLTLLGN